jgi:superfamily II DNA or RNA helicase
MLSLRPHQQCCLDAVLRSYEDKERIISFQMATGSGKTRVLLALPYSMKYKRIIYVFPTLGLIRQFKDDYLNEFTHIFPKYVVASSDSSLTDETLTDEKLKKVLSYKTYCVITTYDSLLKVLQFANDVDCVLFDEAHHANAPECHKSMTEHKEKIKTVIRASATLNESDTPCFTYPFHQAVKDGVCRDYSTYCFIKKKGSEHELISYLEEHRKQTGNSKVMVFTGYAEAEKDDKINVLQFVEQYRDSVSKLGGWIQGVVSSQSQDRGKILETFETNDDDHLSLLVSCRCLGEGIDTKKANVVLFVDSNGGIVTIIQRIGRGTRVYRDAKGNPLPVQRDGSVIVGIYIDPATYEGKSEEEIDKLLKENMSKTGDFSAIFCVLAALRATDPDTYYQCIHFLDRQKTHARIKEQGMDRIEVPRDGNCFFHCVGLQTGETHTQVRQRVIDYMEEHPEMYEEFLSDEDNAVALREEGEWNNDTMDVVVKAAADMLGQTIRVHRPDGRIDEVGEGKEEMDVLLEDNHYIFLTHDDNVYNEKVEEKRVESKSAAPKKKLFIDIDPDFKIMWKVSGDLVNDFTARIDAEIENDGLTFEERSLKRANEFKAFYEEHGRKPLTIQKPKTDEEKTEKSLANWVYVMKTYKKGSKLGKLFPSVEKILVDLLGEDWYENEDLEGNALIKANEFKTFYEQNGRKPSGRWFNRMKISKKFPNKSTLIIYPSVEKILVDLLGEDWYENEDLEGNALIKANEYKEFYKKNKSKPVPNNEPKTDEEKTENSLADWFSSMKTYKKGTGLGKLFPSVEKILVDLLGEDWHENKDFEGNALIKANEFKAFYEQNEMKPVPINEPKTDEEKTEKSLADWFSRMKTSKKGTGTGKLFPSVEKILVDLLGDNWYENKDFEGNALITANEYKAFYEENGSKPVQINKPKTDEEKTENSLASWFRSMKTYKKGSKLGKLFPSVEKILVDLLGDNWYENEDLEGNALITANEFKTFYEENGSKPVQINKPKTDGEKTENSLACWFRYMKKLKKGTKDRNIYPSVEKILVDLLGDNWYESKLKPQPHQPPPSQQNTCTSKLKPQPQQLQPQPQQNTCTSIFKSGPNKGKECGRKNCGVHKKEPQPQPPQALKPMTFVPHPPQPTNPSSDQPRAPRPQSELSLLHKEYKTLRSDNLATKFRENPHLWNEYHQIAEANELSFPDGEVPYQRVIAFLKMHLATFHHKKQKTIVDMGCGTARVHKAFADQPNLTFHNLDHVACDERVTVADIAHTGLEDGYADVAILCLAMWGSNKEEYLTEAFRLLDPNGRLIIVEPSKRWMDESGQHKLRDMLERHGFTIVQEEVKISDKEVHKFSLFVIKK